MAVGKRVHVDQRSLRRVLSNIEAKGEEMKRKGGRVPLPARSVRHD